MIIPRFDGQALCASTDPELYFPDKGERAKADQAKASCALCPVQEQCLRWALRNNERYGVWGGKSERERRELRVHGGRL